MDDNATCIEDILAAVSLPQPITGVEFLDKGFSRDKKYTLTADGAPRYLLRVSDIAETERRREEFSLLTRLSARGIACSPAVHFGIAENHGVCFSILGYLPGDCAEDVLPALPLDDQYAIGYQAGQELRRMHLALEAPEQFDWHAARTAKHAKIRAFADKFGISFPQEDVVERFNGEHFHLLQGRPITFQHDDFHPGNLIVDGRRFAGVIDFNRCDWGDPYHDFFKVAYFAAPISPAFARGQINGYFAEATPADFWPLYTLYVGMGLRADLAWTQRNYPQYLAASYQRVQEIIETHDFIAGGAPAWFTVRTT